MKNTPRKASRWLSTLAATVCLTGMAQIGHAQTHMVTYELQNVWLQPTNHSGQYMTGTFTWTYDEADFEGGTGQFTELNIPWYGSDIDGLNITIESGGLETSLKGNWHDQGCDVNLKFIEPLSTDQPSTIDLVLSSFEIQTNNSNYFGQPTRGSIVPIDPPCAADFNADGDVNTLDVLAFLNAWTAGDASADINGDGDVNTLDVLAFLNAWTTGC